MSSYVPPGNDRRVWPPEGWPSRDVVEYLASLITIAAGALAVAYALKRASRGR